MRSLWLPVYSVPLTKYARAAGTALVFAAPLALLTAIGRFGIVVTVGKAVFVVFQ